MPNMVGDAGFGVRDTVKGMVPGRTCIVKILAREAFPVQIFPAKVFFGKTCSVEVRFIQDSQSSA